MPRPPTPGAPTKPHGTYPVNGPSSLAGNQCPQIPQTVALYLGHLAADGKAMATIEQASAAVSHAHAAAGMVKADNPARRSGRGRNNQGLTEPGPSAQAGRRADRRCPGPRP